MDDDDDKEVQNASATVALPANSTPRSLSLLNPLLEDINFPSHLFHESFRKSFLLELDQLCSLAWEISRMEYEDEKDHEKDDDENLTLTFHEKIEVLNARWNFFDDLYSEHTKCEDLTVFPELNLRVANVTKAYELEHEAEEWLFEEVGGLVKTVWKETNDTDGSRERKGGKDDDDGNDVDVLAKTRNKNDFGKRESIKLVLAKAARGLHATRTMLKAHLAKESAHVLPLLKKHFSEEEQAKMTWSFLEKFPAEKVTGILEWVFGEMMMGEEEHRGGEYLESLEMYLRAPKVKTCAEAMALKSKLKKMIEDVRANDDEEEYDFIAVV
jgi:hemerythrin-like domain-containing protein